MKVQVNANLKWLQEHVGEWSECEGIKFVEAPDGSFDLILTTDLKRMREADAALAELASRR